MPERLVLVGAGGLGRETAEAVRACNELEHRWELLGFVDDVPAAPEVVSALPVLGPESALGEHLDAKVTICTARADRSWSRKQLAMRLALPASRYATVIHPSASLAPSVRIGAGSIVLAGVVATADIVIGEHVAVMPGCVFTHDDLIGSYSTFGAGVRLGGGVTIGEGAYVGSGALVREGLSVGPWALVGMGAVVLGDIPPAEAWIGTPARCLRRVDVPAGVTA